MRISDWSSDVCSSDLLFLGDTHVRGHARKDGRLDVIAAVDVRGQAGAAGFQRRALVDRRLDQTLDLVELRLVDDGADMAARAHLVAHLRAVEPPHYDAENGRAGRRGRGVNDCVNWGWAES